MAPKRKVGIVGYGRLGEYLYQKLTESDDYEVAFVWNRTLSAMEGCVSQTQILKEILDFKTKKADLIVEVAHPDITRLYGSMFLEESDYLIGSPTALADKEVEKALKSVKSSFGAYVSCGAFWGGEDIRRMANSGQLHGLTVKMAKHPDSLKVIGELKDKKQAMTSDKMVLYDGPVRMLCSLAPHNVNTMAAACIAGHNLGFDGVRGCLVADCSLTNMHVIEVDALGPVVGSNGQRLHVHTVRKNPAPVGEVTGAATFGAMWSSLQNARGKGPGIHLC